jgi:hypothetical protein
MAFEFFVMSVVFLSVFLGVVGRLFFLMLVSGHKNSPHPRACQLFLVI